MPTKSRFAFVELLESRVLLTVSYDFIGSSSWTPDPNSPYVSTGNMGDRHYLEPGLSATPPVSGFLSGHASGTSTSFEISNIPEHDELRLSFMFMSKQPTYPIGLEGPEPEDPPPTIVWKYEVWFDDHYRWWHTDGSGWGGDPLHFVHYDDSLAVTIKGTLIVGSGSKWILTNAHVDRYTPTVFMYARDTAIEDKTDYAPGTEPGFVISRSGDSRLGGLDVSLSAPVGTAQAGSDFTQLPDGVTIPASQGEVFVPLSVIQGADIEWTEDLSISLEDGEGYLLGNSFSDTLDIKDDDPVDIAADDLPEEVEDEEYNETNPGLYLLLNDDDDDEDGVIDGWESSPPGEDDEMVQAVLSFQSDEKIIGVPPNQQEAQVTLSLSSWRFRVWHNGELLLGGAGGPLYVVLDHAALEGTMTVMVEFVPPPNPVPGEPYIAEDPFTAVTADLTLIAADVGQRSSSSLDILRLIGVDAYVELTAIKGPQGGALDERDEGGPNAPGWYLPINYGDHDSDGWSGGGWNPDGTLNLEDFQNLTPNPTVTPDKDDDEITGGSPYLFQMVLSSSQGLQGKVRLVFPSRVKVWETNTKKRQDGTSSEVQSNTTEFDPPVAKFFFVEGVSGSEQLKDVLIRADYIPAQNEVVKEDQVRASVFEATQQLRFEGELSEDNEIDLTQMVPLAGARLGFNQSRAGNGFEVTPNTNGFHNLMEAQGTIRPAGTQALVQAGAVLFDYKRDVWTKSWVEVQNEWRSYFGDSPWKDDDHPASAEDRTPSDQDHIYDIDGPGQGTHENPESFLGRNRQILNAREYVRATLYGFAYIISDFARWHSKVAWVHDPADNTKFIREPLEQQKLGPGWISTRYE